MKKDKDCQKRHGCTISLNEMVHGMLEYAEVYTNIKSFQFCTLPLELQAVVDFRKYYYLSIMLLILVL